MSVISEGDAEAPEPGLVGGGAIFLFLGAMLAGAVFGSAAPEAGAALSATVDPTLYALIFLLLLELRLGAVLRGFGDLRYLGLAWGANFLIAPVIGFLIALALFADQPLLLTAMVIYFMAPCTDWFLGFTRMARGDTAMGAALIPINLLSQLALFPFWLWLFTSHTGVVDFSVLPALLAQWFLLPLIAAQIVRFAVEKGLSAALAERVIGWAGSLSQLLIAALIFQIFAVNIGAVTAQLELVPLILLAVFLYFVAVFAVSEGLSRAAGLSYPRRALLSVSLSARNAPLMLAVTAVALPEHPEILAAIVIGMLIEFPHLAALKELLLWRRSRERARG
ncbi:MAG: arsenic resistance protein [Pseudomonadota bacterium]